MNPLSVALKGKGLRQLTRRIQAITGRYGLTPGKMSRAIDHYTAIMDEYGSRATFPVTASAVERNKGVIEAVKDSRIEFAVHGYRHVDHSLLPAANQQQDLAHSRQLFISRGITANGFRCPYLRSNADILDAVRNAGYSYDSSRSLAWDALNGPGSDGYQRALEFYGAQSASDYPALPHIENRLVEIPYCLPDDEALWDRLVFADDGERSQPWLEILSKTHQRGELFTLGLHPERIYLLEKPLRAALERARELKPAVWFARLDEIAAWWESRAALAPEITANASGWAIRVDKLVGLAFQSRGVAVQNSTSHWDGDWAQVQGFEIQVEHPVHPWIGLSSGTDPALAHFLRQQGYILETAVDRALVSIFFDLPAFRREDERRIIADIEASGKPLVRLSRWPHGAKSALCVTGDIDALTIWDYLLRFIGR